MKQTESPRNVDSLPRFTINTLFSFFFFFLLSFPPLFALLFFSFSDYLPRMKHSESGRLTTIGGCFSPTFTGNEWSCPLFFTPKYFSCAQSRTQETASLPASPTSYPPGFLPTDIDWWGKQVWPVSLNADSILGQEGRLTKTCRGFCESSDVSSRCFYPGAWGDKPRQWSCYCPSLPQAHPSCSLTPATSLDELRAPCLETWGQLQKILKEFDFSAYLLWSYTVKIILRKVIATA